jgi:RNA polymerase sigma-70 factor (ECF subfamily)
MFSLDEVAELSDTAAVHEALGDEGRDRVVRRAVWNLPSKYRESLILFYFHDMNVSAAAQSLGLPEGTVKARLSRGREILRSKLPRLLETPGLKEA